MTRFLVRSVISTIITMLLVSILLFLLIQVGSGDITVKILGVFATEEQRASYRAQLGLDAPLPQQYLDWLIGNDWRASSQVGYPLVAVMNPQTEEKDWWADVDGQLTRWKPGITVVLEELKKHDKYFVDSVTGGHHVAYETARDMGMRCYARDVFLDYRNSNSYVKSQLMDLIEIIVIQVVIVSIPHKVICHHSYRVPDLVSSRLFLSSGKHGIVFMEHTFFTKSKLREIGSPNITHLQHYAYI